MYCGSLSDVFETPEAMARIRDLGFSRLSCAVGGGYATKDRMAALAEAGLELCVMVPQDHEVRSVAMAEHAREVTQERHYSYTEDCYGMAIRDVACLGGTYDVHLFFDRTLAQVEVDAIHESAYALLDLAGARASHTDASVAAFAPHILITRDPQDAATNKSFTAKVDTSRTQAEVNDAGYFCIVASRGTDAETVLHVQRLRERMERKHTRYTDSMRLLASPTRRAQVHAGTSFMAFVALVAYASFRHLAGDLVSGHETCSSLLGELRKVQVWKGTDGKGRLAYALTNRRREIFGHLGMDEEAVRDAVSQLEL